MSFISGPPSPCIGICKLTTSDDGEEYCEGCFRQVDEIMNWPSMSDDQKEGVLARIKDLGTPPKTPE